MACFLLVQIRKSVVTLGVEQTCVRRLVIIFSVQVLQKCSRLPDYLFDFS